MRNIKKLITYSIAMNLILFSMTASFAEGKAPIKFFASNNTKEIDAKTAYARLTGNQQFQLSSQVNQVMNENNVKEQTAKDMVGMYQMNSDKKITSDNTHVFYAAPSKTLTKNKIFSIAKNISQDLNQESVAVFIPSKQSPTGDVTVVFKKPTFTINEIVKIINEKCPSAYSDAFSLELTHDNPDFNQAKVISVQWLGSEISANDLKKAFPHGVISVQNGHAYLVYKNGSIKTI